MASEAQNKHDKRKARVRLMQLQQSVNNGKKFIEKITIRQEEQEKELAEARERFNILWKDKK